MKKTFICAVAAGLLFLGFAGQSHASFANGELIRVVFDTATNMEEATVLGTIGTGGSINFVTANDQLVGSSFQASDLNSSTATATLSRAEGRLSRGEFSGDRHIRQRHEQRKLRPSQRDRI